jgi:hypothetical protein
VRVEDETRDPERNRSQPDNGGDVDRFEHRVHGHVIAANEPVVPANRYAVYDDKVDFWVGYTDALDGVFDGWSTAETVVEGDAPPVSGDEVIQLGVKTKPRSLQIHDAGSCREVTDGTDHAGGEVATSEA